MLNVAVQASPVIDIVNTPLADSAYVYEELIGEIALDGFCTHCMLRSARALCWVKPAPAVLHRDELCGNENT